MVILHEELTQPFSSSYAICLSSIQSKLLAWLCCKENIFWKENPFSQHQKSVCTVHTITLGPGTNKMTESSPFSLVALSQRALWLCPSPLRCCALFQGKLYSVKVAETSLAIRCPQCTVSLQQKRWILWLPAGKRAQEVTLSTFIGTPAAGQLFKIQPPHCSSRNVLRMQKRVW